MNKLYILHGPSCIGKTTILNQIEDKHIHTIEVDDCCFWESETDTSNWDLLDIDLQLKNELFAYNFDPIYLRKPLSTKKDKYLSLYHLLTNFDKSKQINISTPGALPYNINDYQFIQSWLERVFNTTIINILVFKSRDTYKEQINQRYKKHGIHIPFNSLLKSYDYCDQNRDFYDQIIYNRDDLKI